MARTTTLALSLIFCLTFFSSNVHAQFWHALSPATTSSLSAGFSQDEKQVFYTSKVNGVENIFRVPIADKYNRIIVGPNNPPVQVTHFTDRGVRRMFHLLNMPQVVYSRATENGKDVHLYRIKDDGTEEKDLTVAPEGVTCEIVGASYNGRYVYYTQNKVIATRPTSIATTPSNLPAILYFRMIKITKCWPGRAIMGDC